MFSVRVSRFWQDDLGGGTIWGLMWFTLLVGISGLSVDSTNGFRNKTMLQATADATALAAAIDLPSAGAAVATAVSYAIDNMPEGQYGDVLQPGDIEIGTWDYDSRTFTTGGVLPDSVRLTLRQTAANANAVPVNFLRIAGFQSWDVNVQAVAQQYIPECIRNGLVARGIVDISSNNGFVNQICIHGQQGVEMQNHNFHELGVTVSMPDTEMLTIPSGGMESNPGLPQALRENILDPRMVNHVDEIMASILNREAGVLPSYIDAALPVIVVNDKFDFATAVPGRIYDVQCNPNKTAQIPNNSLLMNVVIISECTLNVGPNATLIDVVLGSTALGNGSKPLDKANITFSANVNLGVADNCAPGGGVQLFSSASIHFSSTMRINGLQIVAAGDVELGARDQGINGINVQAGQDITLTSNNAFGLCHDGAPDLFTVNYYRLVQ